MTNKFENVPLDKDTKIVFQQEAKFCEYDVLYEKWSWEGITAESLIFVSDDISHMKDEEILNEIKASPLVEDSSKLTIKHIESGYTFINFNFEI